MTETGLRFPAFVYRVGEEPDARFSLANERTFLAWVRTALALIAGGVALESLGLGIHPLWRVIASLILIVAGVGSVIAAWIDWMRTERSLRNGRYLPAPALGLPIAVAVVAAGGCVLVGVLIG
jgi:putative membrane protein